VVVLAVAVLAVLATLALAVLAVASTKSAATKTASARPFFLCSRAHVTAAQVRKSITTQKVEAFR
jgi:hypothetical protein